VDWAGTILHDGAAVTDLACAIVVLASRSCGRGEERGWGWDLPRASTVWGIS